MTAPSRSPFLLALLAAVLVAAGCGGDDSGTDPAADGDPAVTTAAPTSSPTADPPATDGPSATTAPPDTGATDDPSATTAPDVELTATDRGVSADTITLGVSMLDFPFLVENNFSPQGWGDQQLVWQTFIDDLNARGGINGRRVEAVYEFYSPIGSAEADAACLRLTSDVETFAVLGGFLGPAEDVNTCIVGPQDTVLVGGRITPERLEQASAPWLETGSSRSRRLEVFIELLDRTGRLDGVRLAVVGGPQAVDEYEASAAVLDGHGVEVVFSTLNEAQSGDIVAEDAAWNTLAESIRTAGATTVLSIGSSTGTVRGVATNGLDVEIWDVDADALANLGESATPEMADGVITVTGLTADEVWTHPTNERCVDTFAEANPDIELRLPSEHVDGEEQWYNAINAYCRWLVLFELVATAAGPDLTRGSFLAAAEGLGDFELPGVPHASLGPGKYDASDAFRLSVFDPAAGPRGGLVPLTEIIDATP